MNGEITMDWATAYLLETLATQGLTETTQRIYEESLTNFGKYLEEQGLGDLREVDGLHLDGYVSFLRESRYGSKKKPYSAVTIDMRIRHAVKLFAVLSADGYVFSQPVPSGYAWKKEKRLPRNFLTRQEVDRLLSVPDEHTYFGFRDKTMLEILYGTGMRLGELLALDIYDVDFGERLIYIRQGKGRKDRVVPCTRRAFRFLREYLDKVRPVLSGLASRNQSVFVSSSGKRYTREAFARMLEKYVARSGIKKRITPHSFRHTFASHMLAGGANIRYIQQILGHERLATTEIYTRVVVVDLKKMVREFHPLENELANEEELQVPIKRTFTRRRKWSCKNSDPEV
jgi:integrase/recombinase XerD